MEKRVVGSSLKRGSAKSKNKPGTAKQKLAVAPSPAMREQEPPARDSVRSATGPLSPAEVLEIFARLAAANPAPKTELEHTNPFTLLVAVVLSALATDAGVNKATRGLFAQADTPQKMLALGEEKVRDAIKTIGLFNTKAKNAIAISKALVEQYGGEVPATREALQTLPGVGRK